jgi:hypothetical protein
MVAAKHDWERETPPEKVVFTVRLPVSERQWAWTCYGLSAAVGFFWLALAIRPAGPPPPTPQVTTVPAATSLTTSFGSAKATPSRRTLTDDGGISGSGTVVRSVLAATPGPGFASASTVTNMGNAQPTYTAATPESTPEITPEATVPPPTDYTATETVSNTSNTTVSDAALPTSGSMISAEDLISAYDAHNDAAEDRYTRHDITVTGRVLSVGKAADKTPFVLLDGTSDTHVKCLFPSFKGKGAPPVQVGTEVKISGMCEGRFVDIMLSDCRL